MPTLEACCFVPLTHATCIHVCVHIQPRTLSHTHAHTFRHTHTQTLAHTYTLAPHIHSDTHTQTFTHTNTLAPHIHSDTHTHTHKHSHTHARLRHILAHTCTHTQTHTPTHPHTHTRLRHRYNMLLNLMRVEGANPEGLLGLSFKQFQVTTDVHTFCACGTHNTTVHRAHAGESQLTPIPGRR